MADTIRLEIVTPSGVALSQDVLELTAPSVSGDFGVLPGHVPLLAALRTGSVTYRTAEGEERAVVGHGFAEIVSNRALLLTEKFKQKANVDVVQVRAQLKEIGAKLEAHVGDARDPERVALIEEEQWLAAQLELIGDPPHPTVREDTRFLNRGEADASEAQDDEASKPEASS